MISASSDSTAPDSSCISLPAAEVGLREGPSKSIETRANALRHGLTATTLLPQVLRPGRLQELVSALRSEYLPHSVTEEILLHEIARHAAALEITAEAEPAVLRTAAQSLASLTSPDPSTSSNDDLQLATAITAEPLDRVARYRRGHEKALHQALEKLRSLQSSAPSPGEVKLNSSIKLDTEAECESYLRARFASPEWRCPRCRNHRGDWLASRKRWNCRGCGAQIGLRDGTVFARSALPLCVWFHAIRSFAAHPSITASDLLAVTDITRPATACAMLARIRNAIEQNNVDDGLAGLTIFPLPVEKEALRP